MNRAICVVLLAASTSNVAALELPLPPDESDLVGRVIEVGTRYEDTLAALAQDYDMGYLELTDANPQVDPWLPGEGTQLTIPARFILPKTSREGIVINLPEFRLYYYLPDTGTVLTFPIGIGRAEFATPLFDSHIVTRIENPSWTPTESIRREHRENGEELPRVVLAGPDNPLGHLAIQLARPGYFIHGTNKPFGVGQRISHGCVRLYPDDIEALVAVAPNRTRVRVINQAHKVGWLNGDVYLESHRSLDGDVDLTGMVQAVIRATATTDDSSPVAIDWQRAEAIVREGRGLPGRISKAD